MKHINTLINSIAKEKNASKHIVVKAVEKAFSNIINKKKKGLFNIEAKVDSLNDQINYFIWKKVSPTKDNNFEISLEKAKTHDPDILVGETLGFRMDEDVVFSRQDILNLKHVVFNIVQQEVNAEAKKEYSNDIGKLMVGMVKKVHDNGSLVVQFNKITGVIPTEYLIPVYSKQEKTPEKFRVNDKVKAVLKSIQQSNGELEFTFERVSCHFVHELLKNENTEVEDGNIKIHKIVRFPGKKTKILVSSDVYNEKTIMNHLLGSAGYKIQQITNELGGEYVSFVFESNMSKNLVAPVEPRLIVNNKNNVVYVIEEEDTSKFIGSKNSNVLINASLMNKEINVLYPLTYNKIKDELTNFLNEKGVSQQEIIQIITSHEILKENYVDYNGLLSDFKVKYDKLLKPDFYALPKLEVYVPEYTTVNSKQLTDLKESFNLK